MASVINPVSTKIAIELNTTVGTDVSTGNVTVSKLDTAITAAKIAALVTAVTPLLEFPVISTKKTDVGTLSDDGE